MIDAYLPVQELISRLAKNSQNLPTQPFTEFARMHELLPGKPRPAAVLIPLMQIDGRWHVLYTRRDADLPEHSGQVAFPGGRSDPEDNGPEQTALRESFEEIGLDPADVLVIGRLHDFITITNYLVTPIVGIIPWPYTFRLAVEEVSRVFTIPLDWLADAVNFEERWRDLPAPYDPVSVIYYNDYDGETLWGASARFTQALIQSLK